MYPVLDGIVFMTQVSYFINNKKFFVTLRMAQLI